MSSSCFTEPKHPGEPERGSEINSYGEQAGPSAMQFDALSIAFEIAESLQLMLRCQKMFQLSVNPLEHQNDCRQKHVKIIVGDQHNTHLIGRTGVHSQTFEVIEAGG